MIKSHLPLAAWLSVLELEDAVGFEPTRQLALLGFKRPVRSTTPVTHPEATFSIFAHCLISFFVLVQAGRFELPTIRLSAEALAIRTRLRLLVRLG